MNVPCHCQSSSEHSSSSSLSLFWNNSPFCDSCACCCRNSGGGGRRRQRKLISTRIVNRRFNHPSSSSIRMLRKFCRKFYGKFVLCVVVGLLLTLLLVVYFGWFYRSEEYRFFEENYLKIGDGHHHQMASSAGTTAVKSSINLADQSCHLPIDISPFDPSILSYLEELPKNVQCNQQNFRPLTFVEAKQEWGVLRQNNSHYSCHYQIIEKPKNDDSKYDLGPRTLLDPGDGFLLKSIENYVLVQCSEDNYENLHYWFNPISSGQGPSSRPSSDSKGKPSVLILVIESLSQINYRRYLNETRKVLENQLPGKVFYLDGMNKLADNSFPNMAPLLTGKRLYNDELENENYGPYDDWPLIWKQFSAAGYQTALIEDYPRFTLFNYESKGFLKSGPTDFYPRPYWLKLFEEYGAFMMKYFPFKIDPCYRDRVPKVDLFLDQLYHFVRRSVDGGFPFFAFAFYIELTHNNFNKAQTIDRHVANFLRRAAKLLQEKETVLIVMGDHGNRFGPILQTTIGRIEERMPLMAISLPDSLLQRQPHLADNLRENRHRLCTWLDINLMLNDILNSDYSPHPSNPQSQQSVYSPWRQSIPADRNCRTAFIPDLYCVCDRRLVLDHNSSEVASTASGALVTQLNQMLSSEADKCLALSLDRTLNAELIFPSDSTAKARGFKQRIEITVSVAPSQAIFRSRLFRTAHQPDWTVDQGQISRINEYGNQSSCIRQRDLKPYCYCQH